MQDFRTLKLLDRFEQVFRRFDIDYQAMRKILQVKLLMDRRRVPTIFNQSAKKKDQELKDENSFMKSLWIYILFGLFMIPFMIMGDNYFFQMSLVFGILMFMVMTSMISDFSSVLLDIRDKNILHPKPIDRKTISAAKMIHISIYLFFLTLSIIGIPLFVGLFKNGIVFFFISVVAVILIILFVLVFTALLYMFILKFFDGEKLKDLINYVQIGLSLGMMIGYQLLVRSFEFVDFNYVVESQWWHVFIVPMWYGALVELVVNGQFGGFNLIMTLCGIVVPIISFMTYLRLVPTFEKNLQKLSQHAIGKVKKRSSIREWFLTLICSTKEEKAIFRFASLMMKNERDFKLKVYPSLGFSFVLPFIFIMNNLSYQSLRDIGSGKSYLTIYFSLLIIPTVVMLLKFSGKYKGAWIFKVSPIKDLYPIFSGTMKAFLFKLYLPVFLFISLAFFGIFGVRIWSDLLIVFFSSCLYCVICFLIVKKALPFSESFDGQQKDSWLIFLLLIIIPALAGLHFASTLIPFGVYGYLLLLTVSVKIIWRYAFNVSWEKLQ
jgi:ABC-2 type transport system permease protein